MDVGVIGYTDPLVSYAKTVPTKIDASPMRTPNTAAEPSIPHVLLLQLEALLLCEVRVGVGVDNVEDGTGDDNFDDDNDDNIEDNEEGGGGNEIDVAEGPTKQNLCANCSPVNSSCGQLSVKQEVIFCLNPSLSHRKKIQISRQ